MIETWIGYDGIEDVLHVFQIWRELLTELTYFVFELSNLRTIVGFKHFIIADHTLHENEEVDDVI